MKALIFPTQPDAENAAKELNKAWGYPKIGVNAQTGLQNTEVVTLCYSTPQALITGEWILFTPDGTGEEIELDLLIMPE